MEKRPIVFPHVPKCGGTSLLTHLKESGLNVLYDYEAWVGPASDKKNETSVGADFSGYDVIYGHFPITRYDGPDFRYVALVRDPVERAISNYIFHREMSRQFPDGKDFYTRLGKWIDRGELSFVEYLNVAPDMKVVYERFMGYWSPRRFSLIGTTENYDAFLKGLSDLTGVMFENTIRERKRQEDISLTREDRIKARMWLRLEYKWYDEFIKGARS
jgi:hypothetical protein